jgi:predicted GH43/DUF377 family glycosyl hydrolase
MHSWTKKGLLVSPNSDYFWMSHGAGNCWATADGETIRLVISGRDSENRSRLGQVWLIASTHEVIKIEAESLIELGEKGVFDYNGTAYPWVVQDGDKEYLYYTGWTRGAHVDFINDLGLAIRSNKGQFKKVSRAGIFERTDAEPFGTGSVCVIKTADHWKMWYTTFVRWGVADNDAKHYYHIRYAESADGVRWNRHGNICIDYIEAEGEYVTARPCVITYKGLYLMWFSYRGPHYKIGFAVSKDGIQWNRYPVLGLDVSESGWDSEMVSYGMVLQRENQLEMYYSGNGFGRSGLGLATLPLETLDETLTQLGY